jgi:hypothetical protein
MDSAMTRSWRRIATFGEREPPEIPSQEAEHLLNVYDQRLEPVWLVKSDLQLNGPCPPVWRCVALDCVVGNIHCESKR